MVTSGKTRSISFNFLKQYCQYLYAYPTKRPAVVALPYTNTAHQTVHRKHSYASPKNHWCFGTNIYSFIRQL